MIATSKHPIARISRHALGALATATIAALAAIAFSNPLHAGAQDGAFSTKAPRAILMDAASGAVLFQQAADELAAPASMSKLMTLAVLFKNMKEGKVKATDEMVMSANAWRKGGAPSGTSAMMVPVNTKATVDELIKGIAVQSGNDAAIAIAEGLAGNETAFAKLMTAEARRIGMSKSTFVNATGLSEAGHLMTARELAILARHLILEYPEYYPVFATREFPYRKHKFYNRNPLLVLELGVDGLKTGNTADAGFGLVASAVQDGRRIIAVVAGLPTADIRKAEAVKLIEWGFKSISQVKLYDAGEVIGAARVWGGTQMYVDLASKDDVMFSLPKYPASQRLSAEIVYKAPLKPPVKKGDQVATLRVSSTSSATADLPLYATEDVEKAGIMRQGFDSLVLMALRRLAL
ncbi:MAG: D-alanyl-D-alanine carboxypeptidase family protein [Hyphomicrobium sp.]